MAYCPWYVSAAAVRRYQALGGPADFDDASDALIELAAETWRRYQADSPRTPRINRTGAYVYRGPGPARLQLVVSMERRPEGDKPQLVDVLPGSEHGPADAGSTEARRRRNAKRAAQRERAKVRRQG